MSLARQLLLLGLLALPSVAAADFVFSTLNGVVRYSDSGERLIEYGGGDTSAANGGFWLGESVDGIAVSDDGIVYASTNILGSRSLIRFDLNTGAVVPRPDLIPTGDFVVDAPLWKTPYVGPEEECGTEGCSTYSGTYQAAARHLGELLVHPDGHVYASGIADIWDGVPGSWTFVESLPALVRFDLDELDAPSVVSVLPSELLEGDPLNPSFAAQITLRDDQTVQVGTSMAAYGVDVASFAGATVAADLLVSPDPPLTDGLDLSPFVGILGEAFADPAGNVYLTETEALPSGDNLSRLHKFEASTGAYLGVVFEETFPGGIAVPEYFLGSGAFVAVPEPSAVLLSLMAIAGVAARRRG
jgi:hypothetical protein